MTNSSYDQLVQKYGSSFLCKLDEPLSRYTTLRIGGIADLLISVPQVFGNSVAAYADMETLKAYLQESSHTFRELIGDLENDTIKFHILGGGSDTLFSDARYQGVVIRFSGTHACILSGLKAVPEELRMNKTMSRHQKVSNPQQEHDLNFDDLYFEENHDIPVLFFAEAGCSLPYLINNTLTLHLSGLHWFSHIPASVGGAVFNNIHGGKVMFSEYIHSVIVLDEEGSVQMKSNQEMEFAYDNSYIQHSRDIVLGVIFTLYRETPAEIQKAVDFSRRWIAQKYKVQPQFYSAGSTFKNIDEQTKKDHQLPSNSAGYIIDLAGLKGYTVGGAQIYEKHGNFFINNNHATAEEYKKLIDYVIEVVRRKFGIVLEPEIKFINFEDREKH